MSAAKKSKAKKYRAIPTKGVPVEPSTGGGDDGQGGKGGKGGKSKSGCLRLIGLVFLWFFGIVFVIFLGLKVMTWMDDIRFKMMDARDVPARFENMRQNGQIMDAYKLLQVRPESETPAIVAMLMEDIDSVEAPFLFTIAERMYDEKPEEALFWALAARLRLEYDVYRCADLKSALNVYPIYLTVLMSDEIRYDIGDESKTRPLVQRVLDWDLEHSPTYDSSYACMMLTRNPEVVGEARWSAIRYRLRKGASDYLLDTQGKFDIEDGAPQTPDPTIPGAPQEDAPQEDAPQEDEAE